MITWPIDSRFDELRDSYRKYVACTAIFGKSASSILDRYKDKDAQNEKIKQLVGILKSQHEKTGVILEQLKL